MNFIVVYCGEDGPIEIDVRDVPSTNIEEGPAGEDIITWKCDQCHREHKNVVYGRRLPQKELKWNCN